MKPGAKTERYWSVWILNQRIDHWEPYDEGMRSREVAQKELRALRKRYREEKFALVRTLHTRVVTPRAKEK